jgi:mannose-6-phosphate isomerase-like protein (cupin superfamily)
MIVLVDASREAARLVPSVPRVLFSKSTGESIPSAQVVGEFRIKGEPDDERGETDSGCDTRRCRGEAQPMEPGETIDAPNIGMRVTCRESAASSGGELLSFDFWMRGGATPPPMHVHPHQEERITVVSGSVRSRSGAAERVLSPGDTVVSPPGEPHTVGPAGNEDVEMVAELRPALTYEQFIERSFALDRAGHVNAKGRGNPLRMATARPHEAEFFLPRVPIMLQRALLRALDWLGRRLPGPRG